MNLKPLDLDAIPSSARSRRTWFSPDQLAEAIETLKAGQTVSSDETFKNPSAARRPALHLRQQINEEQVEFPDGLEPSTSVWSEDGRYHFAVVLREPLSKDDE